jgi:hypothetical protein
MARWVEVGDVEEELTELRQRAERAEGLFEDCDASNKRMGSALERMHDEREDLRLKVEAVRALCDLDERSLNDQYGAYAIDLALGILAMLDGEA